MLDPKTVDMFYFTGAKHTTPNCPIDLIPDLNPSSGAQSYEGSDKYCSRNALYNIPFFLENLGPRFSEWSVNAHESRPGHHTQVGEIFPCAFYVIMSVDRLIFQNGRCVAFIFCPHLSVITLAMYVQVFYLI